MIGKLIPKKRFDKFIEIIALCSKKLKKEVVGLIIGEGPMRKKLEVLARNYSKKVKIYFLGYQEGIYKYLSISNIFLFPSEHHEVLPMGLIEASASGIPIICSNIPGNNDIVRDGYNGFLINGSEKEYIDCINRILNNDGLTLKMSRNGIKMAKSKFDRNIVVNNVILQYKKLLNSKDYMKKSSREPS
jgi:glycosyltransferase involved in cell wall biosynthesis